MKELKSDEIKKILEKHDMGAIFDMEYDYSDYKRLERDLFKYIDKKNFSSKAILGLDIYKYSQFQDTQQTLIPFLFEKIFESSAFFCVESEEHIFNGFDIDAFKNDFISTGDGGFAIFDTPVHAVVFALYFEFVLRAYNSFHFYPKLRAIIGELNLRYAITYDRIFKFSRNHYGSGIINNARILSKDSLNRCLIDYNTYEWFLKYTDGIENLQSSTLNDILEIDFFKKNLKGKNIGEGKKSLFPEELTRTSGLLCSDIIKIGDIKSKETSLNIYNLHIQAIMIMKAKGNDTKKRKITVTLGNINTTGISDK